MSQRLIYHCSPSTIWVKDADQTLVVDRELGQSWVLCGVEAVIVIWDLLRVGYSYRKIVPMLSLTSRFPWKRPTIHWLVCCESGEMPALSRFLERAIMANLTVSAVCNQHCPYCFTSDHLNSSRADRSFLEISDFDARLDFLDRSGIDQVRLLGGEPTLHPQFPELIKRARARNKKIVVFTNGLMPEEALACLEELPTTECNVLVNVNEPAEANKETFERQRATIHRLGERAF